jgi:DNA replication protein DnaC
MVTPLFDETTHAAWCGEKYDPDPSDEGAVADTVRDLALSLPRMLPPMPSEPFDFGRPGIARSVAAQVRELSVNFEDPHGGPDTVPGLYLYGDSGAGKTRLATWYALNLMARHNCEVFWWTSPQLRNRLASFRNDPGGKQSFLENVGLGSAGEDFESWLFLDDFGHNPSDGFADDLRELLDMKRGRCVITSQYSRSELLAGWGRKGLVKQAEAVMRRIGETLEIYACFRET